MYMELYDFTKVYDPKSITKEYIESKVAVEALYDYYLGVNGSKPGFKCRSPFKPDRTPSFHLYINGTKLVFKDFSSGQAGDIYTLVGLKSGLTNFKEIVLKIAKDFNLLQDIDGKPILPKISKFQESPETIIEVVLREWQNYDLNYWMQFGIDLNLLNFYDVRPIDQIWIQGQFFDKSTPSQPLYRYRLQDKVKTYSPLSKDKSRKWRNNIRKDSVFGINQLDQNSNVCFIASSLKDLMCLKSLGYNGICMSSETTDIPEDLVRWLEDMYDHVCIFLDSDETGLSFAKKMHKKLDNSYLYIPLMFDSKDVADFYRDYGTKFTKEVIDTLLNQYIYNNQLTA